MEIHSFIQSFLVTGLSWSGSQGLSNESYRVCPGSNTRPSQGTMCIHVPTLAHTVKVAFLSSGMFLGRERKPENPEDTHANTITQVQRPGTWSCKVALLHHHDPLTCSPKCTKIKKYTKQKWYTPFNKFTHW